MQSLCVKIHSTVSRQNKKTKSGASHQPLRFSSGVTCDADRTTNSFSSLTNAPWHVRWAVISIVGSLQAGLDKTSWNKCWFKMFCMFTLSLSLCHSLTFNERQRVQAAWHSDRKSFRTGTDLLKQISCHSWIHFSFLTSNLWPPGALGFQLFPRCCWPHRCRFPRPLLGPALSPGYH